MSEQEELEFLVEIAEDRINFFNACQLELLSPDYSEHLANILEAISKRKPLKPEWKQTVNEAADRAQDNISTLWRHFRLKDTEHTKYVDSLIKRQFSDDLYGFMIHDGGNLVRAFYKIVHNVLTAVDLEHLHFDDFDIDPSLYVQQASEINEVGRQIAKMHGHPWRLIRYLSLTKLGVPIEYEEVHMDQQINNVANVLSHRFNTRIFSEQGHQTPLKKSIVVQPEEVSILSDEGLIWSIVYNNMKNSIKKFTTEEDAIMTGSEIWVKYRDYISRLEGERVVYATCQTLNDDYVALSFSDSGSALDINQMITNIRKEMLNKDQDSIDWVSPEMKKRWVAWSNNDYAFNLITMEDIANVAFMARIRGKEMPDTISSGMGLYGTRYIVEHLGGAILYTTTFKDENPVFTYIIPKEPKTSRTEAQLLKRSVIQGKQLVA